MNGDFKSWKRGNLESKIYSFDKKRERKRSLIERSSFARRRSESIYRGKYTCDPIQLDTQAQ